MSTLSSSLIYASLIPASQSYWFSRGSGEGDSRSYENVDMNDATAGDIAWFSSKATSEDVIAVRKSLAQMNLHLYSKELAESAKKGKPAMRRTESGAFSFLVLPNQGSKASNEDLPF